MAGFRLILAGIVCAAAVAQQASPPPPPPQESSSSQDPDRIFRATVQVVVAPVTVLDRDGAYVNGIGPEYFHLADNGKEQNIKVDVSYQPISLVIAIQCSDRMDAILPKIYKLGSLIQPLMVGEQGEVAVIAFDSRVRTMQDFTTDANLVSDAIKKIRAGSSSHRMNDAVLAGSRMLRSRPANRRRVLLLVSETRDGASEGRVKDTMLALELSNVSVYTVNVSRLVTTVMGRGQPPRPDNRLPASHPMPPGVPATPTSVAQAYGMEGGRAEFVPMLVEIFRDVKAIFVDNPIEVYTKGTGGVEHSFVREKDLANAITDIGSELHSQYMISYVPSNREEGGWHDIVVSVQGRRDLTIRTRPGYWVASQ
ncbi:MAG TPA: VWA domain-containing protein [Bryobacteraceae bacterium]|jgi:VWFA-related protein|nr:VWA domain-containing protein [Bryobacteraceae bacterium]